MGDPVQKNSENLQEFVLDTAVVATAQLLLKLRGIVTLPLIAGFLGTVTYGIWSQVLVFTTFLAGLLSLNLHLPLIRFSEGDPEKAGRVYSTLLPSTLILSFLGVGAVFLFADSIGAFLLKDVDMKPYIRVAVWIVLFSNIRLLNLNVYRAIGRLRIRSILELAASFSELALICVALLLGCTLRKVLVLMALCNGVFAVLITCHILTFFRLAKPSLSLFKEALRYAVPLVPASLSIWILDKADRLIIGSYLGAESVGIYSANYAVASLLMLFQFPFQITLLPKVASLWDSDRESVRRYISSSSKIFLTLAIPFTVGIPFVAKSFLSQFGNEQMAGPSRLLTLLISAGILFWGMSIMRIQILHGARKTLLVGIITMTTAFLNLLLNVLFVPLWGINGAAIATLISYAGTYWTLQVCSGRIMHLDIPWMYLWKCVLGSIVMTLILFWLPGFKSIQAIGILAAGIFAYLASLWCLRATGDGELQALWLAFRAKS